MQLTEVSGSYFSRNSIFNNSLASTINTATNPYENIQSQQSSQISTSNPFSISFLPPSEQSNPTGAASINTHWQDQNNLMTWPTQYKLLTLSVSNNNQQIYLPRGYNNVNDPRFLKYKENPVPQFNEKPINNKEPVLFLSDPRIAASIMSK